MLALLPILVSAIPVYASPQLASTFDYVIIGAGPAGLVLANRLTEDPNTTVAVIEAGDAQYSNPNVTRVDGFGLGFGTSIDWNYTSAPQKYVDSKSFTYYSGKSLGGTTTINGMTYIRAEKEQIDGWETLGNPGWNWEALFEKYIEQEQFQPPDAEKAANGASFEEKAHGFDGELSVGWSNLFMEGVFKMLKETNVNAGVSWNKDPNSGRMGGFSTWPFTLNASTNTRQDAARAFYYSVAESRPNLHLFLNTTATRIIWADHKFREGNLVAKGVEVITSPDVTEQTVCASSEILLAAGSLRSSAILENSGVGNPSILESVGIETKVDLPRVGAGLQDQPNMAISYLSPTNWTGYPSFVTYLTAAEIFGANLPSITQELRSNISAYAQRIVDDGPANESTVAIETKLLIQQTDLVFSLGSTVPLAELLWVPTSGRITCVFWTLLPFSKGNVHVASSQATHQPTINPNFLQLPIDTLIQAAIAVKIRSLFATAPLSEHVTAEVAPGFADVPEHAGWRDASWGKWIKEKFGVNYHPVSSTAMRSPEWGGVVDSEGRVYGLDNVRVADAGVFPTQISGHLSASVYAVASKLAEAILAKRKDG